jgi:hypothetical protein
MDSSKVLQNTWLSYMNDGSAIVFIRLIYKPPSPQRERSKLEWSPRENHHKGRILAALNKWVFSASFF